MDRIDIIGQNGNEGLHYEEKKPVKQYTEKEIDALNRMSYSSIALFVSEHFLNEVKDTVFYNKTLKLYGNKYHKELAKQEEYFNELELVNEELLHHSSENLIEFIKTFVSKGWLHFRDWQQVYMAFTMDPKTMFEATQKVLTNPGLNK